MIVANGAKLSVTEFRELGYLQELNRRFLHPLGLAIEVQINPDGSEELGGIWDSRDDPEGIIYGEGIIDHDKARYVYDQEAARKHVRVEMLGFNIQN